MVEYAPLFRLRPRILAFLRARPLSVRHSFAPFLLSKAVARKTQASDLPLTEAKRRHVFNSQRCSKKSKMQIFAFIFAVQPRIKQKISIHKAHDLLYDTLCKKEHKHRGVLLSENLKMPLSASTTFVRSNANGLTPSPYTWTPKAHASLRGTPTQTERANTQVKSCMSALFLLVKFLLSQKWCYSLRS